MSYLREVDLGPSFAPFAAFREQLGFVPKLFRAQTLLPRLIEAETALSETILFRDRALSRSQKERIALEFAAAHRNPYCFGLHHQMLNLLGAPDREFEPNDESTLEAILVTALTAFHCTLSTGLGAVPDFEPQPFPAPSAKAACFQLSEGSAGPHLQDFGPWTFFRENFGFIPNVFRAQTLRPDVLQAETDAIRAVLLTEDLLTRLQKEYILLAVSAANFNTYFVAVHSEVLRALGVSTEDSDQIATAHRSSKLSEPEKALLDFARKLAVLPSEAGAADIELLRGLGFREEQILEAVAMTALTNFLNTLQAGLGVTPDFAPHRVFQPVVAEKEHLLASGQRHTDETVVVDPDAEPVARVQRGDLDAFEDLINRHSQRVYRTLVGILGNPEEARDAMQDTFLKAFQHLGEFQGRSKFSTWLVSIASNTGLQRLRERKHMESLDDEGPDSEEGFRPRQVRAWTDDPEQLYAKAEMRTLVETCVMRLPAKYRVVLVLRDIEQLSTEDAAASLGLGIPAMKARLLRGRLMLREALASHFATGAMGVTS